MSKRTLNENYYKEDGKRRRKIERKENFENAMDNLKNGLLSAAIFLGAILIACIILSAIICPLIYYCDQSVTFNVSNVTNEQYAYMINGSKHLRVRYESEKRVYDGALIEMTMITNNCWNAEKVITNFLDFGNISYEK